jgi:hypothetical protein
LNLDQAAVATMTLARTPAEQGEMEQALEQLAQTGLPVFAADGGSPKPFLDFLDARGFTVLRPAENGLVPQIKLSIQAAARESKRPFILYTEPDKGEFFSRFLVPFLESLPDEGWPGCALAARSQQGLATFPAMQQQVETVINQLAEDLLGARGDYAYGPFLFDSRFAPELDSIPPEFGWGWRFYLFARIARAGGLIRFSEMGVSCPVSQRNENDLAARMYRMKQLKQNIDGLLAALAG